MKKKYLSIIVIIITAITIYLMLSYNSTLYESDYMMVQENQNKIEKNNLFSELKNKEIEFIKNKVKVSLDKEEINAEEQKVEEQEEEDFGENSQYIIKEESEKQENGNKLFKVNKEEILYKLTKEEKKEIRTISKKLSMSDYTKIVSSIKNKGEMECCLEILDILNKRLDKQDYLTAKEVFEPYINVELLERKLAAN
ncbi:hypothetical protein [Clostridium massiliamazoniense]|uniref:hypothetical protein n=1 Tax=Clostridium massiliamazoniense TaxID=1347366 RepID=UPI0006D84ADC|nr:hypothetical protein [Clostridium massiliamazoniense]